MKRRIHRAKNTKKRIFTCASSCYSTDKFCLIIQFCDSYAEIDGYGRTEIVKVYAVVIPELGRCRNTVKILGKSVCEVIIYIRVSFAVYRRDKQC